MHFMADPLFWEFITILGDLRFWIGAAGAALLLYIIIPKKVKGYLGWFIFGILPAVVISRGIVEVIKIVAQIPRPCLGLECPDGYSFPSGHAAVIFSAMTIAILYSKRKKLKVGFSILAVLVAISRVVLGTHRIEDILVGSVIGIITGYLIYRNYHNIHNLAKKII